MTILIFLWYLVTTPTDRLICSLWVKELPTTETLISACGTAALNAYRIDVTTLDNPKVICSRPGAALAWIADDCKLDLFLDNYRLRIIEPNHTEVLCPVKIEHEGEPSGSEIIDQCGYSAYVQYNTKSAYLKFVNSSPKPKEEKPQICAAPVIPIGTGLYQQIASAEELHTENDLTWLAGRLIWNGFVHPICDDGGVGLDPTTLAANPCGVAAARDTAVRWQNQYDGSIYTAAVAYQVPARLLKKVMQIESQFWPQWSEEMGEIGVLQITDNGADVMLRFDPTYDPNYSGDKTEVQFWKKLALRNSFACRLCSISDAVKRTHDLIPMYARLLAAYRCRSVSIDPALSGDEAWRRTVVDYNGSETYLGRVEQ